MDKPWRNLGILAPQDPVQATKWGHDRRKAGSGSCLKLQLQPLRPRSISVFLYIQNFESEDAKTRTYLSVSCYLRSLPNLLLVQAIL